MLDDAPDTLRPDMDPQHVAQPDAGGEGARGAANAQRGDVIHRPKHTPNLAVKIGRRIGLSEGRSEKAAYYMALNGIVWRMTPPRSSVSEPQQRRLDQLANPGKFPEQSRARHVSRIILPSSDSTMRRAGSVIGASRAGARSDEKADGSEGIRRGCGIRAYARA
jgi:hypothetical protein